MVIFVPYFSSNAAAAASIGALVPPAAKTSNSLAYVLVGLVELVLLSVEPHPQKTVRQATTITDKIIFFIFPPYISLYISLTALYPALFFKERDNRDTLYTDCLLWMAFPVMRLFKNQ
jgi:hypothetical protein